MGGRHGIHLDDLYISPEHRGKGTGFALLKTLAEICVERGYRRLEWTVLDWNAPAIAFYESIGSHSMDGWSTRRLDGDALRRLGARKALNWDDGVAARAITAQRAVEGPFRLLRADLLPVVVAVLSYRFEATRVVGYAEFLEQVGEDLDELRDAGFALPRTAQEYVADWISGGYLVRRPGAAAREETVELSRSAADVVRFVGDAQESRSAVTSSRLSNVAGLLDSLARESDPDATTRIQGYARSATGSTGRSSASRPASTSPLTTASPASGSPRSCGWPARCPATSRRWPTTSSR
nr:GNAT family N-acetyltransferase [Tessaracoccus coleopterorum]